VTVDHVGWPYRPEGLTAAQLNLPFCVATLLLEGDAFVDQFAASCVADPARIDLSRRVEVRHDPDITARGSRSRHTVHVEVRLRDGRIERETREAPRGSERCFAPDADIVAKFEKLTRHVLPQGQRGALVEAILGLEKLERATRLVDLLRVGPARHHPAA
jgi:2-methylcitrate dehydratase PrpD